MQSDQTDQRIFVGTNEIVAQQVLNRVFRNLISSDFKNLDLYNDELSELRIHEYGDMDKYDIGDVIWLAGDGKTQDSYMLRSIKKNNAQDPRDAFSLPYVDNEPDFYQLGWKNLNYTPSISASGTYSAISDCVESTFSAHETDQVLHKYGDISPTPESEDYLFKKIAEIDTLNIRNDRQTVFFPFQTGHFTTESVLNGIYRIWDNGFLEMDIVFRLGKIGSDDDSPVISANNLSFKYSPTLNTRSMSYNSNADYFMDNDSLGIFDVQGRTTAVKVGNIIQANRNDFVNTYFADIDFTKGNIRDFNGNHVLGFADSNYMIFKVDTMCQTRDLREAAFNPAANTMTFTNRTRNGFTAVYVTFPEEGQQEYRDEGARNGGLAANSFTCRVVGRWR